ncbi:MAG: cbb3-type cytochrome c oxidase subunit 3 [Gammaproteobacteria bacterium]|nr:cbb3-type cytochrome c oxidase subunit 3 [Gammaproteobacteria bacterium]MDH3448100.1 cbb3-type cytochrome c oxidase subunit 3 [Gammaproteobacteria bacterium]
MSMTIFQSIWTIVVMITFLGIVIWAYSSKRKKDFDEAARLPFADDPSSDNSKTSSE